jgi:tricorn protease-like protein
MKVSSESVAASARDSSATVAAETQSEIPADAKRGVGKTLVIAAVALIAVAAIAFGAYKFTHRAAELNLQDTKIAKLTDSGKTFKVAISANGRYIVYVLRDGARQSLWVRNVATKSDVQVFAPDIMVFVGVSFSPDGNYIYFTRNATAPAFVQCGERNRPLQGDGLKAEVMSAPAQPERLDEKKMPGARWRCPAFLLRMRMRRG